MSVNRDISLNVLAQLSDFQAKMATMPGISEKQAARAALKMQREFTKGANKQFEAQRKAAQKSADAWRTIMATAVGAISFAAVKESVTQAVALRQSLADLTNQLGDTSAQTGISTETLNAFRLASEVSGGSLDVLLAGFKGFPKRLQDFSRGTGEAKFSLEQLGFKSSEAAALLEDTDAATREIVKRLKQVPDVGHQAALATSIWGESGVILNQVLGDRSIEEWVESAKLGVQVTKDSVKAGAEWQANVSLLKNAFQKAGAAALVAFDIDDMVRESSFAIVGLTTLFTEGLNKAIESAALLSIAAGRAFKRDYVGAWEALKRFKPIESMKDIVRSSAEAAKEFETQRQIVAAGASAQAVLSRALEITAEEQKKAKDAANLHTAALTKQRSEARVLADFQRSIHSDLVSAQGEIVNVALDRADKVDDLVFQGVIDEQQAADLIVAIVARKSRDIQAIEAERIQNQIAAEKELSAAAIAGYTAAQQASADRMVAQKEATVALSESVVEGLSRVREANALHTQQVLSSLVTAGTLVQDLTGTFMEVFDVVQQRRLENLDASTQALENLKDGRQELLAEIEATEDAAQKAELETQLLGLTAARDAQAQRVAISQDQVTKTAKAMRVASLFQIGVQTAVAVMQAFAQLGPIAGIPAAIGVTATGVAQAAIVAAQPLPTFFGGGRVASRAGGAGEVPILAHQGEALLNTGAVDALGMGIIDALNAGLEPLSGMGGGGGGSVFLDGRPVGMMLAPQVRRAGPLRDAVHRQNPVGYRSPFGRN